MDSGVGVPQALRHKYGAEDKDWVFDTADEDGEIKENATQVDIYCGKVKKSVNLGLKYKK